MADLFWMTSTAIPAEATEPDAEPQVAPAAPPAPSTAEMHPKCMNCGATIEIHAEACGICGAQFLTRCKTCNTPVSPTWQACPECGTNFH